MADTDTQRSQRKAEENAWYLLATLYGVPGPDDKDLQAQNRVAWNRYLASSLSAEKKEKLKAPHRQEGEMLPWSAPELSGIAETFAKRCGTKFDLPHSGSGEIDFSNVAFDRELRLSGFIFPVGVNFSGATFAVSADFRGAAFSELADFKGANFKGQATFLDTIFFKEAFFQAATFALRSRFDSVKFFGPTHFDGVTFKSMIDFRCTTFADEAVFIRATFSDDTQFDRAAFASPTSFIRATFFGRTSFDDTTFSGAVTFEGATFSARASYINASMERTTLFSSAKFKKVPPVFFGAKLHQDTDWHGIEWPPVPTNAQHAVAFIRAYECLKLEMDRLKKHEDELNFFVREFKCRRVVAGRLRGLPIALYGCLCDHGRSYMRPLVGLLITVLVGAALFWPHFLHQYNTVKAIRLSAGLSVANTFGVFGFRKEFVTADMLDRLPNLLTVVAGFQIIFGAALLFLFGLALRNRFRMR